MHISRAQGTVTYPAHFQLVSAMNPCPCGYHGAKHRYCTCSPKEIQKYHNRISGPLLDRFDIFLSLVPVSMNTNAAKGPTSAELRNQVIEAQTMQQARYQCDDRNATASLETLKNKGNVSLDQIQLVEKCAQKQLWSNRVQVKILRLARTIADLNGAEHVTDEALWEAMTYQRSPLLKKEGKDVVLIAGRNRER
ncbi:ATP-binding protein [Aquibacillus sediminis]|uniref:ATP-binding protein n=1 Tax=Aquibacillus sediminis TaxID=2574734 RepID=UPI001FE502C0